MRILPISLAGTIMILCAVAHAALGWPAMRTELEKVGFDPFFLLFVATGLLAGVPVARMRRPALGSDEP